ncbi:hypothetical protein Tco_1354803 [Tanacetum coccineum]
MERKGNDSSDEEDVFENDNPTAKSFVADEILRNDDRGERDQDNYNGNLFERVIGLKEKLKEAQKEVDSDATNLDKRKIVVLLVNEYSKAAEDKLKLLCQKAKIKWLKEGDRNSSFFHSVIKARKHISRIDQFTVKMEEEWKGT